MAKDIFTIPVTSVASESAFSAGGRVLEDYRSSLSPKTLNALVCFGSWIRAAHSTATDPIIRTIIMHTLLVFYCFVII
ncbi:Putative AC transposase [Apostasia shenzhenica]|uniref:AC transposase n=1 Tax=Apostasia shenzhenica TaxID=1088818 RepID=A0A2I0BD56_9ASPA|nr:Putative AC transposase [Apostasia shenzhenica]